MSQPDLSESVPCGRPRRTRTDRTERERHTAHIHTIDARLLAVPRPAQPTGSQRQGWRYGGRRWGVDVSVRRILLGSRPERMGWSWPTSV
jgi:hypothetical protein